MIETIKDLPASVVIFLLVSLGFLFISLIKAVAWFFQEWWHKRGAKEEKLTAAVLGNTLAITKLEVQIEHLNDLLHIIPKIKTDLDFAHRKIRELTDMNSVDE